MIQKFSQRLDQHKYYCNIINHERRKIVIIFIGVGKAKKLYTPIFLILINTKINFILKNLMTHFHFGTTEKLLESLINIP